MNSVVLRTRAKQAEALLVRFFQLAIFQLFLAAYAIAGPRHGFQALRVDLFAAAHAFAELAFADAKQRGLYHLQQLAVIVALGKEEFLGIRTGCAVSDVLGSILVGNATVL